MWMRPLCRHIPLINAHMQFAYGELGGEVLAPLGNRSYPKRRRLGSLTTSRCNHARRTRRDQRANGANPANRPPICFHGITSQHLLQLPAFSREQLAFKRVHSIPPKSASRKAERHKGQSQVHNAHWSVAAPSLGANRVRKGTGTPGH